MHVHSRRIAATRGMSSTQNKLTARCVDHKVLEMRGRLLAGCQAERRRTRTHSIGASNFIFRLYLRYRRLARRSSFTTTLVLVLLYATLTKRQQTPRHQDSDRLSPTRSETLMHLTPVPTDARSHSLPSPNERATAANNEP